MSFTHTHLIWDFNGTILDDMEHGIRCTNTMLAARGLPVIPSVEAYREIFGFPIDAYYRRLGFDFEKEDYDTVLAPEWVDIYLAGEASCTTIQGAVETIRRVKTMGIPQILLSATKIEMLTAQLERLGSWRNSTRSSAWTTFTRGAKKPRPWIGRSVTPRRSLSSSAIPSTTPRWPTRWAGIASSLWAATNPRADLKPAESL